MEEQLFLLLYFKAVHNKTFLVICTYWLWCALVNMDSVAQWPWKILPKIYQDHRYHRENRDSGHYVPFLAVWVYSALRCLLSFFDVTGARTESFLRKDLLSCSAPSRSQPSLAAKQKHAPISKPAQKRSASSTTASPAKSQPSAGAAGGSRSFVARQPSAPASDSRPGVRKTPISRKSDIASAKGGVPATRKTSDKPSRSGARSNVVDSQDFVGSESAEMLDVTTYLINRMLGRAPEPLSKRCAAEKPKQQQQKSKKPADGDNVSEAGTYTIDDDEDEAGKSEVRQARDRIGEVFGVGDDERTGDSLIRPVIGDDQIKRTATTVDAVEDDVFETSDPSDQLQRHYVRHFCRAFSLCIDF
jgi:hypothetical protein